MLAFNQSILTLKFEAGAVDGNTMGMEVTSTLGHQVYQSLDQIDSISVPVEFPSTLEIKVFGKGQFDTQIDSAGQVVADKYIKITDILIDQLSVARYYCDQCLTLDTGTEKFTTAYWGFNGTVIINLDQENGFRWLAKTQNYV
jgi:hypothetical protein